MRCSSNIKGIDPELEARVTDVADAVTRGSLDDVASAGEDAFGGIVIGEGVAERLGAFVGDEIVLVTQTGTLSPMGVLPRPRRLEVVGIFDLGLFEYDTTFGLVSLETAARLFGRETVEMMELRVDDIYASREVADRITAELDPGYLTDDWSQINAALFSALWIEKMAISIAIGLIFVVSALHIVASLIMLVMEKSRDIAILKTMGAGGSAIRRIFVLQGGIIGLAGTSAGAALGWGGGDGDGSLPAARVAGRCLPDLLRAVRDPAARLHPGSHRGEPDLFRCDDLSLSPRGARRSGRVAPLRVARDAVRGCRGAVEIVPGGGPGPDGF